MDLLARRGSSINPFARSCLNFFRNILDELMGSSFEDFDRSYWLLSQGMVRIVCKFSLYTK